MEYILHNPFDGYDFLNPLLSSELIDPRQQSLPSDPNERELEQHSPIQAWSKFPPEAHLRMVLSLLPMGCRPGSNGITGFSFASRPPAYASVSLKRGA